MQSFKVGGVILCEIMTLTPSRTRNIFYSCVLLILLSETLIWEI